MSKIISLSLFYTSFLPLWISICLIEFLNLYDRSGTLSIISLCSICVIILIFIICMFFILRLVMNSNKEGTSGYNLFSAKEQKTITTDYLLSYILPLVAFDFTKISQIMIFLIFFLMLAFLSVRHNYFSINITLELLGYKFYECDLEDLNKAKLRIYIISKDPLTNKIGKEINIRRINNDYSVEVK